jgi:hypothetical protein
MKISFLITQGLIQIFQKEFHDCSLGLGTRWIHHKKRRTAEFDLDLCPEWTEAYLEQRLNGVTHEAALEANDTSIGSL